MEESDTEKRESRGTGASGEPSEGTPRGTHGQTEAAGRGIRTTFFAFAAILAVGIVFGIPTLPEPFGVDQGIYGYIAERILEGAVDHRDIFDHKPPGIHFAYALGFALFGHKMWSARLLDLVAVILTAWGLYIACRRMVGARAALICGLLYPLFYEGFCDWASRGQPETWVNLAFAAGLAALSVAPTWPWCLAAGLALGFGFWFKPTILLPALLYPVLIAAKTHGTPERPAARFGPSIAALAAGAGAATTVVLLYYAANGALRALYEAVFVFNLRYHARLRLLHGARGFFEAIFFVLRPLFAPALLSAGAVGAAVFSGRRRESLFGLGWLVLSYATIFWQRSFARSHYILVLPPLVFLASLALDRLIELAAAPRGGESRARKRMPFILIAGAAFVLVAVNLARLTTDRWTKFLALEEGRITLETYYSSFWLKGAPGRGGYSFEDLRQIARYVEERTSPDDPVFVWGFRPIIAYLAHRRMPTRFIFRYPLTRANNSAWWAEFFSDLDRSPPVYFVVVLRDRGRYHPRTSKEALESNVVLSRFLHNRYRLERTVRDFEIYRLKGRP